MRACPRRPWVELTEEHEGCEGCADMGKGRNGKREGRKGRKKGRGKEEESRRAVMRRDNEDQKTKRIRAPRVAIPA